MLAPDKGQPVILEDAMSGWPALSKWQDLAYLARVAGPRTVPVEVGKHYLAEGWGQHLMLFSDFVKLHVQHEAAQADADLQHASYAAQEQASTCSPELPPPATSPGKPGSLQKQSDQTGCGQRLTAAQISSCQQQQQSPAALHEGETSCQPILCLMTCNWSGPNMLKIA